jgi:ankyrin repeat protein
MSQQFLKWIQRGATVEVADAVAADPMLIVWRDSQGVSALMCSIYSGQGLVKHFLLVELQTAGVALDLFESAAVGDVALVEKALAAAPDSVNTFAGDGWTALHLAAAFGSPEAVALLLEKGASVDAVSKNPQGNQPLHAALALGRNPDSVRILLEAGADPNARQAGGFTALFSAVAANRRDLAELLIARGADLTLRSDFGQSAAELARDRGYVELADWLESVRPGVASE